MLREQYVGKSLRQGLPAYGFSENQKPSRLLPIGLEWQPAGRSLDQMEMSGREFSPTVPLT